VQDDQQVLRPARPTLRTASSTPPEEALGQHDLTGQRAQQAQRPAQHTIPASICSNQRQLQFQQAFFSRGAEEVLLPARLNSVQQTLRPAFSSSASYASWPCRSSSASM